MNYSQIWFKIIEIIYRDKKSIILELKKNSSIVSFDQTKKELNISIRKNYLESIVKPNVEQIKTIFEKETKKPVSIIYINNRLVEIQVIKKLDPKDTLMISETSIIEKPISYKSMEQTFNESIFVQQHEIEKKLKAKTVNLDFYNKNLSETKTLLFHKEDAEYKKYYLFSLLTLITLVLPIFFVIIAFGKQRKFNNLKRQVEELILLKYRALNYHSKHFINSFLK